MRTPSRGRLALGALLAVVGPGLIAGLSDDDPAGITTYSVLGAQHGYQLLWVLALATVALILFHGLGARMGVVTGQGIIGLIRQRFGVRASGLALAALVVANLGTTCAEFAGLAAGFELFGLPRIVSVPLAAVGVSLLVLRGSFRRIEHIFVLLASVFVAYIASGLLAHPDWGAAAHGLLVPTMPFTREAFVVITATVGTTLAPWGLAFIQSYAVDKQLRPEDLRYERVDVVAGSVLTGVVGLFVIVACAATLHRDGISIESASDAARALEPLAGGAASALFGIGLIGAAVLAASILPLSTAYSVCEYMGVEAALDDSYADARPFYLTYGIVVGVAAALVLIPGAPLVTILVATQVLNAVLLLPLLVFLVGVARDRDLMGEWVASRRAVLAYSVTTAVVGVCVMGLLVSMIL
ncbi:MAG: divalent metal cation transporter [Acidobacteria bacterium]|nr:divalent metal cation transporter [Acidobacteriota bacterium]